MSAAFFQSAVTRLKEPNRNQNEFRKEPNAQKAKNKFYLKKAIYYDETQHENLFDVFGSCFRTLTVILISGSFCFLLFENCRRVLCIAKLF